MYHDWKKYDEAIEEYLFALHINPEDFKCWAYLASAYVDVFETQKITLPTTAELNKVQAKSACEKALSCLSSASPDTLNDIATLKGILETIKKTYARLGEESSSDLVRDMKDLLEKYEMLVGAAKSSSGQDRQKGVPFIVELVERLSHSTEEKQAWKRVLAWVWIHLGSLSLASNKPEEAEGHFKNAIKLLEEIPVQGLRALLVYALLTQKKHNEALQVAEQALVKVPHGYFEREALGDAHFTLNQFEDAIEAWQEALSRRYAFMPDLSKLDTSIMHNKLLASYLPKQDALDIPYKIGISYKELAKYTHDPTKRSDALKQAIKYLEQAHSLYEGDQQHEK